MRMKEHHASCEEKTSPYLYKIGMFAQMNHVTVKTLRFYESQGLLKPMFVDEENGYRYYTMNQMADIHQITALKGVGFTLEDIKKLHKASDKACFLAQKRAEIMEKIAALTGQLALLEGYLADEACMLDTPVLVKTIPAVCAATCRKRIRSYDELFDIMPAMGAEMERLGCECAYPEYCFTNYLEPGYKDEEILIETCESVTEPREDTELLTFQEFPEILAACIYHKGSYDEFPRTYERVLRFIEENGYQICGNIRESYIDGVWNKEREEDWLSEIQIPVQRKELCSR